MLSSTLGIIEVPQVVELLVSAQENCFVSPPSSLHKLESVLAGYNNILEHFTSDEAGGEIILLWTRLKTIMTQDRATLETLTQRLIDLVDSCTAKHRIPEEICRWRALMGLSRALCKPQATLAVRPHI